MKGVTVIKHPLVQHNLTRLRDKRTGPQEFRRVLSEVAALMLYEATRSFAIADLFSFARHSRDGINGIILA